MTIQIACSRIPRMSDRKNPGDFSDPLAGVVHVDDDVGHAEARIEVRGRHHALDHRQDTLAVDVHGVLFAEEHLRGVEHALHVLLRHQELVADVEPEPRVPDLQLPGDDRGHAPRQDLGLEVQRRRRMPRGGREGEREQGAGDHAAADCKAI